MLAPLASGVPSVIVPALTLPLKPEPFGCAGGVSRVVPWTVTVQGGVTGAPVAAQVAASSMPATTTEADVRGRISATPDGAGNVVRSTTRKRRRVTLPPVLLTNATPQRDRPERGVVRGIAGEVADPVRRRRSWRPWRRSARSAKVLLRWIGDDRFCGPGAPRRWPAPAEVPLVSTKMKLVALLSVSTGVLIGADADRRDRSALAAIVAVERVVDRERGQRRVAGAFLVDRVRLARRPDRVQAVGQDVAAATRVVVEDGDAGVVRDVGGVGGVTGGRRAVAPRVGAERVGDAVDAQ